jgi:hypothetical protein
MPDISLRMNDRFMPAASRGQAFIVPLTKLDSESVLRQEVATRALGLVIS